MRVVAGDCTPQEGANTLWAAATLGKRPGAGVVEALEARLRAVSAGESKPQEVSNTLWAYATLGERPGAGVVEALEGRLRAVAGEYKPQDIANTLWAACVLALSVPQIFGGLAGALCDRLLSREDHSQMDDSGRCQLHQVFLMCSLDADVLGSLPESIVMLKDRLGDACLASFVRVGARRVTESKFQKYVSQALQRMGLAVDEEYQCPKSAYFIDIRVRKSREQGSSELDMWAVEVDGPSHFLSCKSPTGATLIKRRHLELLGYNLVSVPHWEWHEVHKDKRAQEEYLWAKLQDVVRGQARLV